MKNFMIGKLQLFLLLLPLFTGWMRAADLQPKTAEAWTACVSDTEKRISSELASSNGFLALDFQSSDEASKERKEALSGEIPVKQVDRHGECGKGIKITDGMLHHWRGSIFIPGVSLDTVLSQVENPKPEKIKQEDVLESKVLEKGQDQLKLFLKLQRSKVVTVRYNTEHLVKYKRNGDSKASSSSIATKIAEIEKDDKNIEREKPQGHDHGYLWKLNSYWRYEQVKGGVLVECESMTLSRSIPSVLEVIIRPIINSIAKESMRRTLGAMRSRLTADRG
jgi:hypothetical protein